MSTDFNETPGTPRYRRAGGSSGLTQLWANPIFKLVVVAVVLVGGGVAASQFLGGKKNGPQTVVPVASTVAPVSSNAEITPQYQQAIEQQDNQRADAAQARGESALPTAMQNPVMSPTIENSAAETVQDGSLQEFLNVEQPVPPPTLPPPEPVAQTPAYTAEQLQQLAGLMRDQIKQIDKRWTQEPGKYLSVKLEGLDKDANADTSETAQQDPDKKKGKLVVSAGSIFYAQMLTEANSDIPGPIMAQILTGPFAGGRAIGEFQTTRNYLIVSFKTIAFKNKNVAVNILALDPESTLGGVATEVDPRYFSRVLLPAAAAFLSEYGKVISTPSSTVSVTGASGGTTTTDTEKPTTKDAMYAGLGEGMDRIAQFTEQEGASIKRLVRFEVGAPMGLFFVDPVYESNVKE